MMKTGVSESVLRFAHRPPLTSLGFARLLTVIQRIAITGAESKAWKKASDAELCRPATHFQAVKPAGKLQRAQAAQALIALV